MKMLDLINNFPGQAKSIARPYFNHSVEFKGVFTAQQRAEMLQRIGLNVFSFPSEMITGCDLLSDSGTSTMTNEQWASLHLGDEAYGSNRGYFMLMKQVREIFGEGFFDIGAAPNAFIFHQGRSAEDALFTALGGLQKSQVLPSNGHFDTTKANIEANNITPVNLFSPELKDEKSASRFKGDMDASKLKELLKGSHKKVPLVFLTITNNTGGGHPVSMQNIREISSISVKYGIPLLFDACRFAENAWFIQQYEQGYKGKKVKEIVREMFSYADGFTISFKKDGLANMGGGLFIKNNGMFMKKYPKIPDEIMNHQITKEGHPTYGGLSGRDLMALVVGLKTITTQEYLDARISQMQDFGNEMLKRKLPVLMPAGGHAIYLDMDKFFEGTSLKPQDFGGVSFTAILLAAYGHRACELGNFAFGHYDRKTGKEILPDVNFVRFAVPRLRYEKQDLDSVAESVKLVHESRHKIPGVKIVYGRELPLRHFKARFEFKRK